MVTDPNTDLREVQDGELEVIQSIFMDDFELVESKTAWKTVNAAHEFRITIRPLEESLKDQVGLKLHFKMPARYPRIPPSMELESAKGLTASQLQGLKLALNESAKNLAGSEMVYELASQAATWITDRHDLDQQIDLDEKRRRRDREEAEKVAKEKFEAEQAQRREEAEQAARLQQMIAQDLRRKGELKAEQERREQEAEHERERLAADFESSQAEGTPMLRMPVAFARGDKMATVKLGYGARDDKLGAVLPVEVSADDEVPFSATGYIYNILSPYYLTSQGKRKLVKVEGDIERVRALRHPNIVSLHGGLLTRYLPALDPLRYDSPHRTGWTLTCVTEATSNQTLEDLLNACGDLRIPRAMGYFYQLALAIEAMHAVHIVHRAIQPRLILVSASAAGTEIKLAGACWYQRLVDTNKADAWRDVPHERPLPDAWICPGAVDEPFLYDKSRDMWELGVVLAQMLLGLDVCHRYPTPATMIADVKEHAAEAQHVRKVLAELFRTDCRKRPNSTKLLSILTDLSPRSSTLQPVESVTRGDFPKIKAAELQSPMRQPTTDGYGFFWQPSSVKSRYRSEFEELEFLGKGGGGFVVKARNVLDGHLYAVKKIKLPHDRASEAKLLREVTIWSRMNHPNIVRYHTSWVETEETPHSDGAEGDSETSRTTGTSASLLSSPQAENDTATEDGSSDSDEDGGSEDARTIEDVDFDLGLDGLDDLDDDLLSKGHSKGVSFPSIHFGNESDPSAPPSTMPSTRAHSPAPLAPMPAPSPVQSRRWLYIQMEYVEKLTLREAIEEGIPETESWRYMYQILSAMLHFTSLNIVHRDLKPSNIFIDVNGDVRIGDFGLAVNQDLVPESSANIAVPTTDGGDITLDIGTSLYIPPESMSRRPKAERTTKYSNKIDMYSLGVVFFELWHRFSTGMERIQVLRELRKPETKLPSSWDPKKLERQTRIVKWCLEHDPEVRASPKDLLESGLLPPRIGDDSIVETIRMLSTPGTPHAQKLLSALFDQTIEEKLRKDFSFDFYDGQGARVENDPFRELVREKLSRVFRRKGAVYADAPLLIPQSDVFKGRNPVRLLDVDGTITCLPFQINIPFCRMVARDSTLTRMKRWSLSQVYHSTVTGGQPRSALRASFDIVTATKTFASEAEVVLVTNDVMTSFPFPCDIVHVASHGKLLEGLLDHLGAKQMQAVLEVMVKHDPLQKSWSKTASELLNVEGLSRSHIDELALLAPLTTIASLRNKLLASSKPSWRSKKVREGLAELGEVLSFCEALGVTNIKVAPLLAKNLDLHRDSFFFETHHLRGKAREVIAAGGRFDDIVLKLAPPDVRNMKQSQHFVGVSIGTAQLSRTISDAHVAYQQNRMELEKSYGPWIARRCDVYVISYGAGLTKERLEVAKQLWQNGISADIMYDDEALLELSPERLLLNCRREGILWLVLVKPGKMLTVRVRSVLKGDEEEVGASNLSTWLSDRLHELNGPSTKTESRADHLGGGGTSSSGKQMVHFIQADGRQRGKPKQKFLPVQRAQGRVSEAIDESSAAPVFALEMEGALFDRLARDASWLEDDEAYKALVDQASIQKRDYLREIRKTIRRTAADHTCIWLVSLKDDRAVLLNTGGHR